MAINALLKAALRYARFGWRIFPVWGIGPDGTCQCGDPKCDRQGKHPCGHLVPQGYKNATSDLKKVKNWWNSNPEANIGLACAFSGVVALDVDPRSGGNDAWAELCQTHGHDIENTVSNETGGGGRHFLYVVHDSNITKGKLGPGVDVKYRGYIILPPSTHVSGRSYSWATECAPWERAIASLPVSLANILTAPERKAVSPRKPRGAEDIAIAARCLEQLSLTRCDSYKGWIDVGMALSGLGNIGLALWDTWSRQSTKYEPDLCAAKWGSFEPDHGLTLGSLVHWAREDKPAVGWAHGLPKIKVSGRQLPIIVNDVISALAAANNPPSLFTKATNPTRLIVDENGRPIAQQLQMAAWQGVVADAAIFQKVNTKGDVLNTFPNGAIVKATMTRPPSDLPFPPLLAIIQTPVVRPDGSLLLRPGYDPLTRLYYAPDDNLNMPPVPTKPTRKQVQKAFKLLREPIAEFPFVAEADAANALALLLTPLVRPMLPHGVPMALLDKPERGTGASLLAEVVALLTTGHPAPMMKAPEYEEEWDKRITAMLLEGRTLVVIDNVDAPLQSQALSLALTSDVYSGRRLGYSQQLALPHRIIWVATGNNISFKDSDMPRRCYRVRLDAGMAQPWLHRKGFRHPRLKHWLSRYRGRILCAALAIVRAWIQNGKKPDPETPMIGSYEDWCETLGGILKFVGQEGFLGNLDELYEEDTGRSEWDRWIEALREVFGERRFTMAEVAVQLSPSVGRLLDALPTDLTEKRRRGGSFTRSLGRAFSRHKGHATVSGLVQRRGMEGRAGWNWYIVKQKEQQEQGVFDFFQRENRDKS